jgi:predicted ATPase
MKKSWYVLTGGPATGKTSVLEHLKERGYHVVPEAARTVIDEAWARGQAAEDLRQDEKQFQIDVFRRKQAIEAELDASETIFFDRGLHDTLAYFAYHKFALPPWIKRACQQATYSQVFIFEPLPRHIKDYARVEPESFTVALNKLLRQVYSEAGIDIVSVPFMTIEKRAEFILSHLNS